MTPEKWEARVAASKVLSNSSPQKGGSATGTARHNKEIDFTLSGFMCLPFIFRFVLIAETVYFQTLSSIVSCFTQSNLKVWNASKTEQDFSFRKVFPRAQHGKWAGSPNGIVDGGAQNKVLLHSLLLLGKHYVGTYYKMKQCIQAYSALQQWSQWGKARSSVYVMVY